VVLEVLGIQEFHCQQKFLPTKDSFSEKYKMAHVYENK